MPRQGPGAWLQVLRGEVSANGATLAEGDAIAVSDEAKVGMCEAPAEVFLFDLA